MIQAEHWWNNVGFFTRSRIIEGKWIIFGRCIFAVPPPASISDWRMLCAWAEGARGTQGVLDVPELKQQPMPLHSWALQGQGSQQRWLCKSFLSCSSTDNLSIIFSRKDVSVFTHCCRAGVIMQFQLNRQGKYNKKKINKYPNPKTSRYCDK